MKAFRLAALIAVPATLVLSACAGGSSGIIGGGGGVPGQQANVRFVNGEPGTPTTSYDIYFQSNGSAAPSTPLISGLIYAEASDFKPLPTVAGSVIVHTAGSSSPASGAPALTSCPVPQFANNTNYSIVIATANGVLNCILFNDANYTAANQFRFHDASPNATAAITTPTIAYGTATAPGATGETFAVLSTATLGIPAAGNGGATAYPVVMPTVLGTTNSVSFAVGPNSGATASASNTLDASALMLPGSQNQPNAGNNNFTLPPGGSYAGASIYALDCGAGTLPPGSRCVTGNYTLIGVFDSH
jgi:hypothetical protein